MLTYMLHVNFIRTVLPVGRVLEYYVEYTTVLAKVHVCNYVPTSFFC